MKVSTPRWGEVTIKKQGEGKNKFDCTKSFSIEQTENEYSIEDYIEVLKIATNLTKNHKPKDVLKALTKLMDELVINIENK